MRRNKQMLLSRIRDKIYIMKLLDRYMNEIICSIIVAWNNFFIKGKDNIASTYSVHKILLIKLWGVGNITILLPIVKSFKERYEDAELFLLTYDLNKGLTNSLPFITKTFYVKFPQNRNIINVIKEFLKYLGIFRKEQIDLLVNFESNNRILAMLSYFIGAKVRIGFNTFGSKSNYLYTDLVDINHLEHVSKNYLRLAQKADVKIEKYQYLNIAKFLPESDKVKRLIQQQRLSGNIIVLHIGSSENFKGKRWPNSNFARLADMLAEKYHCVIIFTGTEAEKEIIEEAINSMKCPALNLCGKLSMEEFIKLLTNCYLFISNNTGPLHIASSIGLNTVGLYGPTNPSNYCNLNNNSINFYKSLYCSPCLTETNVKTSFCKNNICLDTISVKEVFERIIEKFFIS